MDGNDAPTRIGAWERARDGDHYTRLPGAHRWADVEGFALRPEGLRVLFFGESAARGLFYEPVITPAKMIERRLRDGGEHVEVVDLARTGGRVRHVLDAAEAGPGLSPDAVVVFAGNNWKYELTDGSPVAEREAEARALRREGIGGLLRRREAALAEVARRFVHRICDIYRDIAPVVFVLPESNLLDWSYAELVPVLSGGSESAWHRLAGRLRDARAEKDWDAVLTRCDELHELDGGISGEPFRMRAAALLERGDTAGALENIRRARDVRLWYDTVDPAWTPSAAVAAARETAAARGARVVDLTEILPGHADRGIPDRTLFLDWCHFTHRGLRVVATETTDRLTEVLGLVLPPGPSADTMPDPDPETEAGARLSAAIVNGHWGQPEELLDVHATAAVEAWPGIVTAMESYCADRGSPAPWWMRPQLSPLPNIQRFQAVMLTGRQSYDETLVDVLTRRIDEVRAVPAEQRRVRRDSALVPRVRTDLFNRLFVSSWRPVDWMGLLGAARSRLVGAANSHRHYYRAHSETSRFLFVLDHPAAVELEITTRLGTPGSGVASVRVNGHEIGEITLTDRWHRSAFRVEPALLRPGRNHVEVHWRRRSLAPQPLNVLAERLSAGLTQELSVVFGEVFSLHATADHSAPDQVTAPPGRS